MLHPRQRKPRRPETNMERRNEGARAIITNPLFSKGAPPQFYTAFFVFAIK